ncbi:MAG: KpsF/GutQ family sugar-phosphate isomerase, partial [Candidatus Omnitrophica bacterium]|nr:KpsF/GutQ family sugar-phosphate isomerase [Candidatus Omnitrophota bacterium]
MLKKRAKQVLKIEADSIRRLSSRINKDFEKAVNLIYACKGRVVVTGMGKAGIIGEKISATLASTGTPSLWLHSAEAIHGDLGRVQKQDVIIAISNSGETEEIVRLIPNIKKIGAKLIAITGNIRSTLAKNSDALLDVSIKEEACPLGLAPMASTTTMLAMGDALCAALIDKRGFKRADFAFLHPGGSLGKQLLLKVEDIMRKGAQNPIVKENAKVKSVLLKITAARAGSATVVDDKGKLKGIFTDGDLRRHLEEGLNLSKQNVKDVMTKKPRVLKKGRLA